MLKTVNSPVIPAVGEGKRGVDGHLGYLLRQAHAAHRIRMERALAELDVTLPQFSVLTMLAAYPGASGADLARLSLLTPQTMSVIVHNLERAGAVSRHPHPVHGRIQLIELTDSGRQLLDACRARVQPVEAAMDGGLDEAGQQLVRSWLVRLAQGDGVL
ncbi:MarR family winged helix-turn-helix transcriptional regulator [Rugamonas apoptosis]|uniref:MarR family transcriptional regulator n=1 Tax=Rugamonas apoptosis TaxID=2758570 RepID=A0A7W2FA98_9BURK|nr:MarR family transcriptional regulator [Rugamonas apoptosis]MBA5688011.1 MarR family transcriptional regulator [Rugamonas apoptosis]